MKQNVDSNQENVDPESRGLSKRDGQNSTSSIVEKLEGGPSPTLIYGSNPSYVTFKKGEKGWTCDFVADASLNDAGIVDQSFPVDSKKGLSINQTSALNPYGIFFATLAVKTKITVCGVESCKIEIAQPTLLIVDSSQDQLSNLFQHAKPLAKIKSKKWDLYFIDSSGKTFQTEHPAKLEIQDKTMTLDWNSAFDRDGKTSVEDELASDFQLKWIDSERPILIGTFARDNQKHFVIGIEQFELKPNS